jgi:hypothetical protein
MDIFPQATLGQNEVPVKAIKKQADEAGHAWATIRRASIQLGIKKIRTGFGKEGNWGWKLPKMLKESIDAHDLSVSINENNEHLCGDYENEDSEERRAIQQEALGACSFLSAVFERVPCTVRVSAYGVWMIQQIAKVDKVRLRRRSLFKLRLSPFFDKLLW